MKKIRAFFLRLANLWQQDRREREMSDELEANLQLHIEDYVRMGLAPLEARRRAILEFGKIESAKESYRDRAGLPLLETFVQDLRYGIRLLRKAPAFTTTVILTIALGVGANTAVFSLLDAVLLRSLPVAHADELVFLETAGSVGTSGPPPYPCFVRLRAETGSFAGLAAFSSDELRIEINGQPEQVMGQVVSGNYFELLGVKPSLGRLLRAEDEQLNPPTAVISHRYWRKRFGGDPGIIGKVISYRKQPFTIIGVTQPEFLGLQPGSPVDITFPISTERELLADAGAFWLQGIIARLKYGTSSATAQAEADTVFRSFMSSSRLPADLIAQHFHRLEIQPAGHGLDVLRRRFAKPLAVLMGIVGLLLLLAIANIANLLLARGVSRGREFAIRLATGAGRLRIVRQLLTETLLLFCFGTIPGVLFARWSVGIIEALFREGRRALTVETGLDWRAFTFLLTVTTLAGLMAGLFPAVWAFRTNPEQAIQEGHARASESRGSAWLMQTLVAFQVALSLVLLVGAVTFGRTLINLRHVDPGFQNEDVLTMSVQLPAGYTDVKTFLAFWNRALDAVRGLPDVRVAAVSTFTPLSGRDRGTLVRIGGYEPPTSEDAAIHINQVSEGYFEALGIPLLRGRLLTDKDAEGGAPVVLINESASHQYFGRRDPIGKSLEFFRNGKYSAYQVVGVVRDTKHMNLREASARFAFLPIRQPRELEQRLTLIVAPRTPQGERVLLQPVRKALVRIDPGILISDVISLRHQLNSTLLTERLLSGVSGVFGVLAMLLAAIGLYGILSYRIGRQQQAIGIRMALGATPSSVARSILRQSGQVVALGLLAGLPFAIVAARLAGTLLWGVTASDPMIYLACAVMLLVVSVVSAYLPARRASGIEPAEALRHG